MAEMTSNIAQPQKTIDEMLRAIDEAMAAPRLIGSIMGMPVYADGRLPDRMVEIRSKDQVVRFRADHPYLGGTKLAAAAGKP
jgi:hypothetical protein